MRNLNTSQAFGRSAAQNQAIAQARAMAPAAGQWAGDSRVAARHERAFGGVGRMSYSAQPRSIDGNYYASINRENARRQDDLARYLDSRQMSQSRTPYSVSGSMDAPASAGGAVGGAALSGLGGTQRAGMQRMATNRTGGAAHQFQQDGFGNFYDSAGNQVDFDTVQRFSAQEVPLWKTEGYAGDSYIRGIQGVDALQAYDAETRRMALTGLVGGFQSFANRFPTNFSFGGGSGHWGGGWSGGPSVGGWPVGGRPHQMPRGFAPPPPVPGAQSTFNDIYRGMAQGDYVNRGREDEQLYGQYQGRAADAYQQNVLGGLRLSARQQSNAAQRQNALAGMMGDWGIW